MNEMKISKKQRKLDNSMAISIKDFTIVDQTLTSNNEIFS